MNASTSSSEPPQSPLSIRSDSFQLSENGYNNHLTRSARGRALSLTDPGKEGLRNSEKLREAIALLGCESKPIGEQSRAN